MVLGIGGDDEWLEPVYNDDVEDVNTAPKGDDRKPWPRPLCIQPMDIIICICVWAAVSDATQAGEQEHQVVSLTGVWGLAVEEGLLVMAEVFFDVFNEWDAVN